MVLDRESNKEFEERFLLAIIHDDRFRDYAIDKITSDLFTEWKYNHLFELIVSLKSKKKPISFFGLYEAIRRDTSLSDEKANEVAEVIEPYKALDADKEALNSITNGVIPIAEDYIREKLTESALYESADLHEQGKLEQIPRLWTAVEQNSVFKRPDIVTIWESLRENDGDLLKAIDYQPGIPTGLHGTAGTSQEIGLKLYLDDYLFYKGIGRGQLMILQGDSGYGKTTLLFNIMVFMSLLGYRIDYYTLEMPKEYAQMRIISIMTDLPTDSVTKKGGKFLDKMLEIEEKYPHKQDIRIFESDNLTISTIAHNSVLAEKEGQKRDVVVLDYVDLLHSDRHYRERWQEIGQNAIEFRAAARDLQFSAISPSQSSVGTFQDQKKGKGRRNMTGATSKIYTCDILAIMNSRIVESMDYKRNINRTAEAMDLLLDKNRFGKRGAVLTMFPSMESGRFFNPLP